MSTYVIGDVQGCFIELQNLLQLIQFDPQHDKLWFTGDLVNRGPDSLNVLRFIQQLQQQAVVVLGNHDLHLLAVLSGKQALKATDTFMDVLDAPDATELALWLRQQPLLHHDVELGYTMIHAGLAPQWDLATAQQCAAEVSAALQNEEYAEFFLHMYGDEPKRWDADLSGWERLRFITNCLTRIRFCDLAGNLDLKSKGNICPLGYIPWFNVPDRRSKDLHICFGHWAAWNGLEVAPNTFNLDSGCVWGGKLTAMCLENKAFFSVSCT